jgi:hypothetical protein
MLMNYIDPEHWKDIPGSASYQISNYGNVRRKKKSGGYRCIKPFLVKNKWLCIKVDFKGVYKTYAVHHIVAAAFNIRPTAAGQYLYHKNGLKHDNYAGNLEWMDRKELGKKTGAKAVSIAVEKIDPDTGKVLDYYRSIARAARDNYIH